MQFRLRCACAFHALGAPRGTPHLVNREKVTTALTGTFVSICDANSANRGDHPGNPRRRSPDNNSGANVAFEPSRAVRSVATLIRNRMQVSSERESNAGRPPLSSVSTVSLCRAFYQSGPCAGGALREGADLLRCKARLEYVRAPGRCRGKLCMRCSTRVARRNNLSLREMKCDEDRSGAGGSDALRQRTPGRFRRSADRQSRVATHHHALHAGVCAPGVPASAVHWPDMAARR